MSRPNIFKRFLLLSHNQPICVSPNHFCSPDTQTVLCSTLLSLYRQLRCPLLPSPHHLLHLSPLCLPLRPRSLLRVLGNSGGTRALYTRSPPLHQVTGACLGQETVPAGCGAYKRREIVWRSTWGTSLLSGRCVYLNRSRVDTSLALLKTGRLDCGALSSYTRCGYSQVTTQLLTA